MASFLEDFFARLEIAPLITPNLENLTTIMLQFCKCIPFENIDVVQKKPIDISPDVIHEKLLKKMRGGYCWELNLILLRALEELNYNTKLFGCKVRWNKQPEQLSTYTHNFLTVSLSESENYIVDVGFAGTNSVAPIRFDNLNEPQKCPEGTFRVIDDGEGWRHLQWEVSTIK